MQFSIDLRVQFVKILFSLFEVIVRDYGAEPNEKALFHLKKILY